MVAFDSRTEIGTRTEEIHLSTEYKIFNSIDRLKERVDQLKMEGKRIGYVTGTFDVEHLGHSAFLDFAKIQCDVLIVGVANDQITIATKGREFFNQKERAQMLSSSAFVDLVFSMDNPNAEATAPQAKAYLNLVTEKINPDVIIASSKTDANYETKRKEAELTGAKFIEYSAPAYSSSTQIRAWVDQNF